jgi:hypothetical protein
LGRGAEDAIRSSLAGRRRDWRLRPLLRAVNRTVRVRALGIGRRRARSSRGGEDGPHLMLGCFKRALCPGEPDHDHAENPQNP